jgi:hypothetical protein
MRQASCGAGEDESRYFSPLSRAQNNARNWFKYARASDEEEFGLKGKIMCAKLSKVNAAVASASYSCPRNAENSDDDIVFKAARCQ